MVIGPSEHRDEKSSPTPPTAQRLVLGEHLLSRRTPGSAGTVDGDPLGGGISERRPCRRRGGPEGGDHEQYPARAPRGSEKGGACVLPGGSGMPDGRSPRRGARLRPARQAGPARL